MSLFDILLALKHEPLNGVAIGEAILYNIRDKYRFEIDDELLILTHRVDNGIGLVVTCVITDYKLIYFMNILPNLITSHTFYYDHTSWITSGNELNTAFLDDNRYNFHYVCTSMGLKRFTGDITFNDFLHKHTKSAKK